MDTQRTLPFGTPMEVGKEVRERIKTFGMGGGFIFNAIHNIQALTPVENVMAMFEAAGPATARASSFRVVIGDQFD